MAVSEPFDTDPQRVRVWALAQVLKAHGFVVQVSESEPLLEVTAASETPIVIRCAPRQACGSEMWFSFADGEAFAPADDEHIHDAVVAVKGRYAGQTAT